MTVPAIASLDQTQSCPEPAVRAAADRDEMDWVVRGAQGDRLALTAIARAHQDAVYRLLWRLSGEREISLDLAQETFIRAFGALAGFRVGAPVRPWLFRIANNLFLDHLRRHQAESLDAALEAGYEPGGDDPALTWVAEGLDLDAALASLPVPWRQAVVLRHFDDLAYEAIAEILSVPLGTAKTWIFRGRERLRDLLEGRKGDRHDVR